MTARASITSRCFGGALVWGFIGIVLVFLYVPLLPPLLNSFRRVDWETGNVFANYAAIFDEPLLIAGVRTTALIGFIVSLVTPIVALFLALAMRHWGRPRLILGLVLLPLFVPGVSMGAATAIFFRSLGVEPSLLNMCVVQSIWALPFATLVIMTVMANFEQTYLEVAYVLGANRFTAFCTIELPCIWGGLLGAAALSLILSFNETIRTSIVQGGQNTVQTYIWSQYQQVGLSPSLYALMTLLIVATLVLLTLAALATRR